MVPGPARILPPRARPNPSCARPLGAFCTNDFHPRTNEPSPAAAHRISARTNSSLHVRTRAPARTGRNARTNSPATRPNPSHPSRTCLPSERTPKMHVRTQAARCRRPYPPPRTTRPNHPGPPHKRAPRAHARTRATVRTPLPAPPSPPRPPATTASPATPPARSPSLRSGLRPGAAPVPPSASLPEDRYHPVNANASRPVHGTLQGICS